MTQKLSFFLCPDHNFEENTIPSLSKVFTSGCNAMLLTGFPMPFAGYTAFDQKPHGRIEQYKVSWSNDGTTAVSTKWFWTKRCWTLSAQACFVQPPLLSNFLGRNLRMFIKSLSKPFQPSLMLAGEATGQVRTQDLGRAYSPTFCASLRKHLRFFSAFANYDLKRLHHIDTREPVATVEHFFAIKR